MHEKKKKRSERVEEKNMKQGGRETVATNPDKRMWKTNRGKISGRSRQFRWKSEVVPFIISFFHLPKHILDNASAKWSWREKPCKVWTVGLYQDRLRKVYLHPGCEVKERGEGQDTMLLSLSLTGYQQNFLQRDYFLSLLLPRSLLSTNHMPNSDSINSHTCAREVPFTPP